MMFGFGPEECEAIALSIKVACFSTLINLPVAVVFAYILAKFIFRGKTVLDSILCLPLVLPPVTTGYLLLVCLGKNSHIGSAVYNLFGIRMSFSTFGAVIASMVVSFPLVMRAMKVSFEMTDRKLEQAAETLGAPPWDVFRLIVLPIALPGVINGIILGFARSLGEFGATITFAGNISGETQTLPLAVYSLMQVPGRESQAMKLVIISVVISFAAMIISELLNRRMIKRNGGGQS
jgi:molybdate transport system permease protein